MSAPASILIIKLRHHGDVLLTTPVARALKTAFPDAQVDLLVYEGMEALVKNNPDLRHVWTWNRSVRGIKGLWAHAQLFAHLWTQHYDVVLHLSEQMQGALLARLLKPKKAIGFAYAKRQDFFWRSCFTDLVPVFHGDTHHAVEHHLAALEPLQIKLEQEEMRCRLVVDENDRHHIQERLQQAGIEQPFILIHPTARWFFKCWEDDRFATVIQTFADRGWSIVLTSSPEAQEMMMIESILHQVASPHVFSFAGKVTLGELAALIEKASLFVGVDSAPMHMAAALRKKMVVLFGPSKIKGWSPWMTDFLIIRASDYGPLIDPDAVVTSTHERYLSNIPVTVVIEAIEKMVASMSLPAPTKERENG